MIDLNEIVKGARTAVIAGHVRPDGDAVGACIGLMLYLEQIAPGLEIKVCLEDFSDSFRFLEGMDKITPPALCPRRCDVFFAVDTAAKDRLGDALPLFEEAALTVCIDHHISDPGYAMINEVDADASSASEVVCRLMTETGKITPGCANALYLGIVHDSGQFNYSCTSPDTMRMAAMLMEKGASHEMIIDRTFREKTLTEQRIMGAALANSVSAFGGRLLYSVLDGETLQKYGAAHKDLDGISSQLRTTKGVDVSFLLSESEPGIWKASLRAGEKVDVNRVAAVFGGGGHVRAAGCTLTGSAAEAEAQLKEQIGLLLQTQE